MRKYPGGGAQPWSPPALLSCTASSPHPPPFPMCGPLANHPLTLEILAHVRAKLFSLELSNPWNIFPKLC